MHTRSLAVSVSPASLALFALMVPAYARTVHAETSTNASVTTAAEAAQHAAHTGAMAMLPIAVDGAKDPERVPTAVAYRHLIAIIAIRDHDASAESIERRRVHLSRIGLSEADEQALSAALRGVGDELNSLEQARRNTPSDAFGAALDLNAIRVQERDLLDTARERFGSTLSADGSARFDSYVQQHVKRRIVIYGVLPK
jgi:hypothetical protein